MAKDYGDLVELPGFSRDMITTHLDLYRGYVDATNELLQRLSRSDVDVTPARAMQRRLGWEYNGMRLHELYFGGMTPHPTPGPGGIVAEAIERSFGDIDAWWESFCALSETRGNGWAVLAHEPRRDLLINTWIDAHDTGALIDTRPVLVMDLFEHAYLADFGVDRSAYRDAYRAAIDWFVINERVLDSRT